MLERDSSAMRTNWCTIPPRGQVLHDHVAGPSTGEPRRDDGLAERPQRARDVDALAARLQVAGRATVPAADLEVRDAQGLVDRCVERDRQKHGKSGAEAAVRL